MQRERTIYTSNDPHGLNGVQVTSSTPKVTPRSQQAFENLFAKSSSVSAESAQPRSRDLVLQMYAHIKTHRKLEHEREIRASRAERGRQAKHESFPFILTPSRFNRKWRGDHPDPMRSPSPGNDVNLDADADANTDSGNTLAEIGGSTSPDDVFQSGSGDDVTLLTDDSTSTTKNDTNPVTTGSDPEMISNLTEKSDAFPNRNIEDGDEDRRHPSPVAGDDSSSGKGMERPERYKIQFHQTASYVSVAERRGIKCHWDSVKAGAVVPAPVSVVTFDGSLFT